MWKTFRPCTSSLVSDRLSATLLVADVGTSGNGACGRTDGRIRYSVATSLVRFVPVGPNDVAGRCVP